MASMSALPGAGAQNLGPVMAAAAAAAGSHRGDAFAEALAGVLREGDPRYPLALHGTWVPYLVPCALLAQDDEGGVSVIVNRTMLSRGYGRGLVTLRRVLAPELPGVEQLKGAEGGAHSARAYAEATLAARAAATNVTTGVVREEWMPLWTLTRYLERMLTAGKARPIHMPGLLAAPGSEARLSGSSAPLPAAAAAEADAADDDDETGAPAAAGAGVPLPSFAALMAAAWGLYWQQDTLKFPLRGWVDQLIMDAASPGVAPGAPKPTALCPAHLDASLARWRAQFLARRGRLGAPSVYVAHMAAPDIALLGTALKVALARSVLQQAPGVDATQREETLRVLGSIPLAQLVPGGASGPHADTLSELAKFLDQMVTTDSWASMLRSIVGAGGVYAGVRQLVQLLGEAGALDALPAYDAALPDALTSDNPIVRELKGR